MFKKLMKGILKITGFVPYFFYLKPRYFYENEKAKKGKKIYRDGVIFASNHTKILDYYCYLLKFFGIKIHAFVADVVYKLKGLRFLNNCMENIEIKRDGTSNIIALSQGTQYLQKKHSLLIFPEGKLEDKKGKLEKFSDSTALLAIRNKKSVVPIYTDGNYGMFKRPIIIIGEPLSPDLVDNDLDRASEFTKIIRDKIVALKAKAKAIKKYKTNTVFTKKYWIMDFSKITSIPLFYMVFPTKKYYMCKRSEVKKALKYNAIISGNHCGPCDPLFIYHHFFSRRVKILSIEQLWEHKFIRFCVNRAGVIKYHRDSMQQIDVFALKECIETLEGNGVLGIFPEGHINFSTKFDDNIKGGTAMMSLMTNSPIIPFVFANQYRYFRFNRVVIGKPIYPSDYFDLSKPVDEKMIDEFNKVIYDEMKELYLESLKRRSKHGDRGNIRKT